MAGILGIQLGHFVFFGCVASGLAALLDTASTAFGILRVVGAVYLCYLGLRLIVATTRIPKPEQVVKSIPTQRRLVWQGFAIQVTNPKALLFMSALLPQFIRPDHPLPIQLGLLLGITIAVDVVVLSMYAWLAMRGARSLQTAGLTAWLERALGAALLFFGVRLLVGDATVS